MAFVIQSGSKQYTVVPGQQFIVDSLKATEGDTIDLNLVYSYGDQKDVKTAQAKVVRHQRGIKLRIVKFKSKSNYHRQYGYRHEETVLEVI